MPTDQQLKLALAKLLPEKIRYRSKDPYFGDHFIWVSVNDTFVVKETEWLHICWLIKKDILTPVEYAKWELLTGQRLLSWQEDGQAICEVKGVKT